MKTCPACKIQHDRINSMYCCDAHRRLKWQQNAKELAEKIKAEEEVNFGRKKKEQTRTWPERRADIIAKYGVKLPERTPVKITVSYEEM